MSHIEEYKESKTIHGYEEEEAEMHENIFIRLALKDAKGQANLREKIALRVDAFLGYNNIDYLPKDEIFAMVDEIIIIQNEHNV